jgi:type I restriction enzyme S subunit
MTGRWHIPERWKWTTASAVADIIGGGTPTASTPENFATAGIPWVTPADLSGYEGATISRGRRDLSDKGYGASGATLMPAGSVLFSSRAPIGYCVIAANPIATNQGFKSLRFRSNAFVPEFFRYYLLSAKEYAESLASGTTFLELSGARMAELLLPVAPLNEQRRIVAKLEALQARSRRAREALDAVPPLLEKLRQSILAAAFRGDLTKDWRAKHPDVEPASELLKRIRVERRKKWEEAELAKMVAKGKRPGDDRWKGKYKEPTPVDDAGLPELPIGWCWARTSDVVAPGTVISYGIVLPGPRLDDGVPYIRGQDIEDGQILTEQLWRTTPEIASAHSRSELAQGDVLLCIIRHLKVALVPSGLDGANVTQGTVRLRPSSAILAPYLARYLEGPSAQGWMKARYFGNAMPRINVEDAREIPVAVAPIAEQEAIVVAIAKQLDAIESIAKATLSCLAHHVSQDRAVLAKAFRGGLVPQDPSDEPVDAMLARTDATGSDTLPSQDSTVGIIEHGRRTKRRR